MAEVTMQTKDVLNLASAIDKLSNSNQDFPTKFLYALSKTKNKLNQISDSYTDVSSQLYSKYKLKGKARDKYTEADEKNLVKIDDELATILKEEVKVEIHLYPSKDFFESVENMKPTPGYSLIMDHILTDEDIKPAKNESK